MEQNIKHQTGQQEFMTAPEMTKMLMDGVARRAEEGGKTLESLRARLEFLVNLQLDPFRSAPEEAQNAWLNDPNNAHLISPNPAPRQNQRERTEGWVTHMVRNPVNRPFWSIFEPVILASGRLSVVIRDAPSVAQPVQPQPGNAQVQKKQQEAKGKGEEDVNAQAKQTAAKSKMDEEAQKKVDEFLQKLEITPVTIGNAAEAVLKGGQQVGKWFEDLQKAAKDKANEEEAAKLKEAEEQLATLANTLFPNDSPPGDEVEANALLNYIVELSEAERKNVVADFLSIPIFEREQAFNVIARNINMFRTNPISGMRLYYTFNQTDTRQLLAAPDSETADIWIRGIALENSDGDIGIQRQNLLRFYNGLNDSERRVMLRYKSTIRWILLTLQ